MENDRIEDVPIGCWKMMVSKLQRVGASLTSPIVYISNIEEGRMRNSVLTLMLTLVVGTAMAEEIVTPNQEIESTKSYTSINYNRQDSDKTGTQKIINDHSWFNINVQIIKKGALFKDKDIMIETEEKN